MISLENYRMNKTALYYLTTKKNKDTEILEIKKINSTQNIKNLMVDIGNKTDKETGKQEIL